MSLLSALLFGSLLGLKHSIEPDHLIAVTNMVTESKDIRHASRLGFIWGLGHTLTLMIVGMLLFFLKVQVSESVSGILEAGVGVMLIYFGILTWRNKNNHTHEHGHEKSYKRTLFMGFVHGISGSGSLVLLTVMTVKNPIQAFIFITVFGIGTTLSMILSTTVIGIPFSMSVNSEKLNTILTKGAAAVSVLFGIYYASNSLMP